MHLKWQIFLPTHLCLHGVVGGHDKAEDEPDHQAGLLPALPVNHGHPHSHTGDLHRRRHDVTMSRCHEAGHPSVVVSTASVPQTGDGQPAATGQWRLGSHSWPLVLQYSLLLQHNLQWVKHIFHVIVKMFNIVSHNSVNISLPLSYYISKNTSFNISVRHCNNEGFTSSLLLLFSSGYDKAREDGVEGG